MNEKYIGYIYINPYKFLVFDEGIMWKAVCEPLNAKLYARSIAELEESVNDYLTMYFDEEPF